MECCRCIVQLCKDCLLIVYQFASEAKSKQQAENENSRYAHHDSYVSLSRSTFQISV